jgi:transcriptional regulator with XRE-family HTH domain
MAQQGEKIQKLRKALGLSQERLAQLIGVSFQTVNRWEGNLSVPTGPAALVIQSLEKIVASGKADALLAELEAGNLAGGTGPTYHRIFSMAFGMPQGTRGAAKA